MGYVQAVLTRRGSCLLLLLSPLTALACDEPEAGPCEARSDPIVVLGQGVGGAFEPLAEGQVVGLDIAPQGGFGVTVLIRTEGLIANGEADAEAQLDIEIDGQAAGTFLLTPAPLLCQTDGSGGRISVGTVVGLDPDIYSTNDDLVELDGKQATLDVTVTDGAGNSATTRQRVVISAGG